MSSCNIVEGTFEVTRPFRSFNGFNVTLDIFEFLFEKIKFIVRERNSVRGLLKVVIKDIENIGAVFVESRSFG
jgi:hypothetical protein